MSFASSPFWSQDTLWYSENSRVNYVVVRPFWGLFRRNSLDSRGLVGKYRLHSRVYQSRASHLVYQDYLPQPFWLWLSCRIAQQWLLISRPFQISLIIKKFLIKISIQLNLLRSQQEFLHPNAYYVHSGIVCFGLVSQNCPLRTYQ